MNVGMEEMEGMRVVSRVDRDGLRNFSPANGQELLVT